MDEFTRTSSAYAHDEANGCRKGRRRRDAAVLGGDGDIVPQCYDHAIANRYSDAHSGPDR